MTSTLRSLVVVDDEKMVAEAICALCRQTSAVNVLGCAYSGLDGVNLIEKTHPEIALVDLGMPILDGIGVTARVQQLKLRTHVLILTGYT